MVLEQEKTRVHSKSSSYRPIEINVIETEQTDEMADIYRPKQA
jgi:hypothetical protein